MSLESLKLKIPFFTPKKDEDHEANMRAIDRWQQELINALLLKIRPAGLILPWAGDSSPDDDLFVFPYGQTLTNADTSYPRLWTNISSSFKSGTSIILPDLRGRGIFFLDNMGGSDAARLDLANTIGTSFGEQYHTLTISEMPTHIHEVGRTNDLTASGGGTGKPVNYPGANASADTSARGGDGPHNNMPPGLLLNALITL